MFTKEDIRRARVAFNAKVPPIPVQRDLKPLGQQLEKHVQDYEKRFKKARRL